MQRTLHVLGRDLREVGPFEDTREIGAKTTQRAFRARSDRVRRNRLRVGVVRVVVGLQLLEPPCELELVQGVLTPGELALSDKLVL